MAASLERAGGRARRSLPLLLALALAAAVLRPALRIGFLADDFYMVRAIAEQAEETPGLLARFSAGAVRQWSTRFHAFRPLTVISLQVDHALHGIDARGYRLTNLLLWLCAASLFAALCTVYLRLDSALGRAGAFLAFALWPGGVEPIAWTVIRQDALLAIGALGAALALGRWRARPWIAAVPLAVAFGAKETALVLPFALVALDAALLVRAGEKVRSATLARRSWSWFALLALWSGARLAAGASDTWSGQSYLAQVVSSGTAAIVLERLPGALRALVAPVNLDRGTALERILLVASLSLPAVIAVACALPRRRRAELVAGSLWLVLPLFLLLPFYGVGTSLQNVRIVLLPGILWLFLVVAGAMHIVQRRPRAGAAGALLFLAGEAATLRFDLAAYEGASARVERLCADARAWPEGDVLLVRARDGSMLSTSLRLHQGAYVLSSALPHALGPPFRATRLVPILVEGEEEASLPGRTGFEGGRRPTLAALVSSASGPRLFLLGEAGSAGAELVLAPGHGVALAQATRTTFAVEAPAGAVAAGDACRIVVRTPAGAEWSEERTVQAADAREGRVRLVFDAPELALDPARPASSSTTGWFAWSATFTRGGVLVARSAYAIVALDGEG